MKKWISTILSISLVIGMAAVLHACGKPKPEAEVTTEESVVFSSDPDTDVTDENIWNGLWNLEDESYTEPTTDEHYQEEYDALTLPVAAPTQPAAGTTRAQTTTNPAIRETTTQFMFTSPSRASTTKKTESETATAAKESTTTTKPSTTAAQSAEEETTLLSDVVANAGGVQNVTTMPRPQVTYLDKYVLDIFKTGNFTLETETKEDGMTMPITLYEDDNNLAVEMTLTNLVMQDLQLPSSLSGIGKVRLIINDKKSAHPKAYIAWTGGYMEMEDADEIGDMIREMQGEQDMNMLSQLTQEGLEYCGTTTGRGYVCESYKNTEENMQYNFYFTKTDDYEGIVRWDRVDLSTGQTDSQIVMRLTHGVTNKKAFKVEGKKTSMEDFEKMFGE